MTIQPLRPSVYEGPPISWQAKFGRWGNRFYNTLKFGYNADVGTSYEDIWSPGGSISFLSSASLINIVSDSVEDKGTATAGTGARTIRIEGLDGNYNKITEDITLNGTSSVQTTNEFLRVYRAYNTTVGTSGVNLGTISITAATGDSLQSSIEALRGQTLMTIYTVRDGYYGLITQLNLSVGGSDSAEVELRTINQNGASRIKYIHNLGTGSIVNIDLGITSSPILLDPKTDVLVRGKKTGTGGSTTISSSFVIWEVKEEEINL